MIKSELIQLISQQNTQLTQGEVEAVINVIFNNIADALANGNRVELRGFGTFSVKKRPAHLGRNPKTGTSVFIEEKLMPQFRMGKELKARLNAAKAKEETKTAVLEPA